MGRKSSLMEERLNKENLKALLVGTYQSAEKERCEQLLVELESLGETFGLKTVGKIAAPLREINAGTFLGKGKIEEIKSTSDALSCDIVIFDDEISPQQQRNIEKLLGKSVIDRT